MKTIRHVAKLLLPLSLAVMTASCATNQRPPEGGWDSASVVQVRARKWAYSPSSIKLKKGVPVVFEVTSDDVHHGFNLAEFGLRADAVPGRIARVEFTPTKTGTFTFHCDYFCGEGHEEMAGELLVE